MRRENLRLLGMSSWRFVDCGGNAAVEEKRHRHHKRRRAIWRNGHGLTVADDPKLSLFHKKKHRSNYKQFKCLKQIVLFTLYIFKNIFWIVSIYILILKAIKVHQILGTHAITVTDLYQSPSTDLCTQPLYFGAATTVDSRDAPDEGS